MIKKYSRLIVDTRGRYQSESNVIRVVFQKMSSFTPGTKIKVALIGCGRIARHLSALHDNHKRFQIVALCDADSRSVSAFNDEVVLGDCAHLYSNAPPHIYQLSIFDETFIW